jgi:hypothetical protein
MGATASPYAIFESAWRRPLLSLTGTVFCGKDEESDFPAGIPMHPAAITAAMQITRRMMTFWFIQDPSTSELFISVVDFELFCS